MTVMPPWRCHPLLQDQRSQHGSKAKALKVLRAWLCEAEQQRQR
jgi:protein subunit release factor A